MEPAVLAAVVLGGVILLANLAMIGLVRGNLKRLTGLRRGLSLGQARGSRDMDELRRKVAGFEHGRIDARGNPPEEPERDA